MFSISKCIASQFLNNKIPLRLFSLTSQNDRKYKKPYETAPVRKRGGGYDQLLTEENRSFLKSLRKESYKGPLNIEQWPKYEWSENPITVRSGVIAIKLGSIPQWQPNGTRVFCTVLQILDNHIISYTSPEQVKERKDFKQMKFTNDGEFGMQVVGAISSDHRIFTKDYLNLFLNAGVPPKRILSKFIVSPHSALSPGTKLTSKHFRVGDYVDCHSKTIGWGFAGVMKRWGMKGGPASHGATKFHRRRGTVNSGRKLSRILPGTKMPGMMGQYFRKLKGLQILRVDDDLNLLFVKGKNIPGSIHSYIRVTDCCFKHRRKMWNKENHPPHPTANEDYERIEEKNILHKMEMKKLK
ncbi:hypothetical protein SNEBB_006845 [Seison nebaliae]|nr:hypothetical protein SNEBB_006845 [Seison nebaliae]